MRYSPRLVLVEDFLAVWLLLCLVCVVLLALTFTVTPVLAAPLLLLYQPRTMRVSPKLSDGLQHILFRYTVIFPKGKARTPLNTLPKVILY